MPTYRVFVNKQATGNFVTGTKADDAYMNAASSISLNEDDDIQLLEVKPTVADDQSIASVTAQDL
ncbi:hypothetical protein [Anaerospora hongkongensis]|uniref:hypothetical protein n=1 Tax=Anaerospora hongkongensis TaxID=244830 RepID=UPI002FDAEE08